MIDSTTRTIVYLATVAERSNTEVEHLRKELIEAMRINQELTEQVKVYEAEMEKRDRAIKQVIAAATPYDLCGKLRLVYDAAMGVS